jgi:polyphosphate kinase
VNALINAARNGKRVLVIVELAARFDEENNIKVTQALQEAGAKVILGVQGLKVHCKLIQISRREGNRTVRYAHIGTGNFNENTAGIYTDISLLTANQELAAEVRKVFDFFESNFQRSQYRHLILSPFSTRRKLNDLINEEIDLALAGKPAWITFKVNNLVDAAVIRKLYEASQAGVKINLIVRGTCSLIPGIPEQSENINAVSIVGRYLEHSRIYAFGNGGKPLYFISSADLMTRNLDFRVEVTVPILDERGKKELQDYLDIQLNPKAKARRVDKSLKNEYIKPINEKGVIDTQEAMYRYFGSIKD